MALMAVPFCLRGSGGAVVMASALLLPENHPCGGSQCMGEADVVRDGG